jgi:hypothetical protein
MNDHRQSYRRGSLAWPIVLICFGIVFLLNNLGVLSWDVWMTIFRLWPLLLVVVGLDILLGRRPGVWTIIPVFLIVGLLAGGVWLVQSTRSVWAGETTSQIISHPIGDASSADVDINFGVGELEIMKTPDAGILMEGTLDITEDESLIKDYFIQNGVAYLELESTGTQFYPSWLFDDYWDDYQRNWELNLTDDIPIDLSIDTGVGQAIIDLADIQLEDLNIDSGIGETRVYLPDSGSFNAWISLGIGELVVYVPSDLLVRIHMDTGLGNNSISGDYIHSGSVYYSPGFDDTGEWVELYVDGGIGDVRVVQVQ